MNIELNDKELDIVMKALMLRPYVEVVGLINKIAKQANEKTTADVVAPPQ